MEKIDHSKKRWGRLLPLVPKLRVYELTNCNTLIGRSAECNISIYDKRLTLKHCCIVREQHQITIIDLSDNGTFFQGKKIGYKNSQCLTNRSQFWLVPKIKNNQYLQGIGFKIEIESQNENKERQESCIQKQQSKGQNNDSKQNLQKFNKSMKEQISCPLCFQIMISPVLAHPCSHRFCGACLSELFVRKKYNCIQCRAKIQSASKDHTFNNIIDNYITLNPSQKRLPDDINDHMKKNIIKNDHYVIEQENRRMMPLGSNFNLQGQVISRGIFLQRLHRQLLTLHHLLSSNYHRQFTQIVVLDQSSNIFDQPSNISSRQSSQISSTSTQLQCTECHQERNGFRCGPEQQHVICQSCNSFFAKRLNHKQCCEICEQYFCNLYHPPCSGAEGLHQIKQFRDRCLLSESTLRNNIIQLDILRNYLFRAKIRPTDIFNQVFNKHIMRETFFFLKDRRILKQPPSVSKLIKIKDSSVVCDICWPQLWFQIIFQFRRDIFNELPYEIRAKINCHWGVNCKIAPRNIQHARRFNHMVHQTLF